MFQYKNITRIGCPSRKYHRTIGSGFNRRILYSYDINGKMLLASVISIADISFYRRKQNQIGWRFR